MSTPKSIFRRTFLQVSFGFFASLGANQVFNTIISTSANAIPASEKYEKYSVLSLPESPYSEKIKLIKFTFMSNSQLEINDLLNGYTILQKYDSPILSLSITDNDGWNRLDYSEKTEEWERFVIHECPASEAFIFTYRDAEAKRKRYVALQSASNQKFVTLSWRAFVEVKLGAVSNVIIPIELKQQIVRENNGGVIYQSSYYGTDESYGNLVASALADSALTIASIAAGIAFPAAPLLGAGLGILDIIIKSTNLKVEPKTDPRVLIRDEIAYGRYKGIVNTYNGYERELQNINSKASDVYENERSNNTSKEAIDKSHDYLMSLEGTEKPLLGIVGSSMVLTKNEDGTFERDEKESDLVLVYTFPAFAKIAYLHLFLLKEIKMLYEIDFLRNPLKKFNYSDEYIKTKRKEADNELSDYLRLYEKYIDAAIPMIVKIRKSYVKSIIPVFNQTQLGANWEDTSAIIKDNFIGKNYSLSPRYYDYTQVNPDFTSDYAAEIVGTYMNLLEINVRKELIEIAPFYQSIKSVDKVPEIAAKSSFVFANNNTIEAFLIGMDNTVYHNYFSNGWSGWSSLDKGIGGFKGKSIFAVANPRNNNIEVFSIGTDNKLYHNYKDSRGWNGWSSTNAATNGVEGTNIFAVANPSNNNIEVFLIGMDTKLYHCFFDGKWNGWSSNDSKAARGIRAKSIFAVANPRNKNVEVFVIGKDNTLSHNFFAGGKWEKWSKTRLDKGGASCKSIFAIANPNGNLEVFLIAENGLLYHNYTDASGWKGWSATDLVTNGAVGKNIFAVANPNGNLEAFLIARNGYLYHNYLDVNSKKWMGWNLSESNPVTYGAPVKNFFVVANPRNNNLEAFLIEESGLLHHNSFAANKWNTWNSKNEATIRKA